MIAAEHERDILTCGIEQGIEQTLLNLIKKKLARGKDIATIAEELEVTEEEIRALMERNQL